MVHGREAQTCAHVHDATQVIQLQGDQRKNVQDFLLKVRRCAACGVSEPCTHLVTCQLTVHAMLPPDTQEKLVKKDQIKIHGF
jgi:hypothetical protein